MAALTQRAREDRQQAYVTYGHTVRARVFGGGGGVQTCREPVVPCGKHLTQPQITEAEEDAPERPPGPISPQFTGVKRKLRAETFGKSHKVKQLAGTVLSTALPMTIFKITFSPNT